MVGNNRVGINPFPNKPRVLRVCNISLLKTLLEKEKLLKNKKFLLLPWFSLLIYRIFCHFHQIWNCHLHSLSVWKSLEFVVYAGFTLPIRSTQLSQLPKVPDQMWLMACIRLLLGRYSIIPDSRMSAQDSNKTSTRLTTRLLLEHSDLNRIPTWSDHKQLDSYTNNTRQAWSSRLFWRNAFKISALV